MELFVLIFNLIVVDSVMYVHHVLYLIFNLTIHTLYHVIQFRIYSPPLLPLSLLSLYIKVEKSQRHMIFEIIWTQTITNKNKNIASS